MSPRRREATCMAPRRCCSSSWRGVRRSAQRAALPPWPVSCSSRRRSLATSGSKSPTSWPPWSRPGSPSRRRIGPHRTSSRVRSRIGRHRRGGRHGRTRGAAAAALDGARERRTSAVMVLAGVAANVVELHASAARPNAQDVLRTVPSCPVHRSALDRRPDPACGAARAGSGRDLPRCAHRGRGRKGRDARRLGRRRSYRSRLPVAARSPWPVDRQGERSAAGRPLRAACRARRGAHPRGAAATATPAAARSRHADGGAARRARPARSHVRRGRGGSRAAHRARTGSARSWQEPPASGAARSHRRAQRGNGAAGALRTGIRGRTMGGAGPRAAGACRGDGQRRRREARARIARLGGNAVAEVDRQFLLEIAGVRPTRPTRRWH